MNGMLLLGLVVFGLAMLLGGVLIPSVPLILAGGLVLIGVGSFSAQMLLRG